MGLDTSHGAWHGAYSAFMRWREMVAEVAGMPPLRMMEGFWERGKAPYDPATMIFHDASGKETVERFCQGLPIKWEAPVQSRTDAKYARSAAIRRSRHGDW